MLLSWYRQLLILLLCLCRGLELYLKTDDTETVWVLFWPIDTQACYMTAEVMCRAVAVVSSLVVPCHMLPVRRTTAASTAAALTQVFL